jgi:hypothetical protein
VDLIFFEGDTDNEGSSSGFFDYQRPALFDSFFPYCGLISDQKGFLFLDFTISGEPQEDTNKLRGREIGKAYNMCMNFHLFFFNFRLADTEVD